LSIQKNSHLDTEGRVLYTEPQEFFIEVKKMLKLRKEQLTIWDANGTR